MCFKPSSYLLSCLAAIVLTGLPHTAQAGLITNEGFKHPGAGVRTALETFERAQTAWEADPREFDDRHPFFGRLLSDPAFFHEIEARWKRDAKHFGSRYRFLGLFFAGADEWLASHELESSSQSPTPSHGDSAPSPGPFADPLPIPSGTATGSDSRPPDVSPIPEPASLALASVGGLVALMAMVIAGRPQRH